MGKLDGKVAIITGGASGIGEASVKLFVDEGARVVIADIQDERGTRLAESCGANATYLRTDASREADVKAVVECALEKFGRLDCVFNNAGVGGPVGPIAEISVDAFDAATGILLRGVFLGMKHAASVMKRQGSGSIISTASISGLRPNFLYVYGAAKAAVIHLTQSVAMELGESGVRVNCICPGFIATPIFGRTFGLSPETADQTVDFMKGLGADRQPIPRTGRPEDIAQAALWLAGDDASFVNGHALVVDGGFGPTQSWSESMGRMKELATAMGGTLRATHHQPGD